MTRPLMIGLMLSKSDRDVIEEVMTEYCKQFDTIFCIEASDDDSIDVIRSFDKVEYVAHEKELGISGTLLKDGIRQLLLSRIQDKYGYDGWIFPIHSDEIYHGKLENLIECGISENSNVLNTLIAHFVIREGDTEYSEGDSVQDALRYYFIGQCEIAGYKNNPGLYYNFFEHMRVLPHGIRPVVTCSRVIIRKHYNMRTPEQLFSRIADRVTTGWQPAYAAIQDAYITDPNSLITAGEVYTDILHYKGQFKIPKQWNNRVVE